MKDEDIRRLVKIVEESNIADLEVSRWGRKVKISKYPSNSYHAPAYPGTHPPIGILPPGFPAPIPAAPAPELTPQIDHSKSSSEAPAPAKNLVEIKSPMVGTFYRAPAPDADAYVQVGGTVSKGQVLCIIEAMKLMNEIEAEFSCRIVEILVDNGQPVEYNQPLFKVEKI
ncbi:MAG: acetyl-CoA carboxylase biotin carboxyl carrier protein [candidate division KSB1 bacterium]|nr:acetyl-CoA carboxylase biotin carboxyl carrier protein [candidate division KSB1 bacterium]